jgi:hypothetical protein
MSKKETKERTARVTEVIERIMPDRPDLGVVVDRQGVPRKRTRVAKAYHPYLTERQRTVLKGKPKMARAWQRILKDMKDNDMTMKEFVESLSPEELVRGTVKNKNGHFSGRPTKWVPREFHRACIDELMKRGQRLWQENYLQAIQAMTEIASGKGAGQYATPGERIKAAQFVIERLEGKVPEKLHVTSEQPWALVLDGIVAEVSDEAVQRGQKLLDAAHETMDELEDVIDAELVDEEPDPVPVRSRRRRK